MTAEPLVLDMDDRLILALALAGLLRHQANILAATNLGTDERARWTNERDRTAALRDAIRASRTITITTMEAETTL